MENLEELGDPFEGLDELLEGSDEIKVAAEEYENIEGLHYLFDRETLLKAMIPMAIIVKDRQEVVSRSLYISSEKGKVYFTVNTGEIFYSVEVPVLNMKNLITNSYIIEFKTLLSVIRSSGSKVLLMEYEKGLKTRVLSGELEFDVYTFDNSIFEKKPLLEGAYVEVESVKFFDFVNKALKTMSLAVRVEDKRVRLKEGEGFSNFLSSVICHKTDFKLLDLGVRGVDLLFLSKLVEPGETIKFFESKVYKILKGESWILGLPKIETDDLLNVKGVISKQEQGWSFSVSPKIFLKVLSLFSGILGCSGVGKLNLGIGGVDLVALTSTGKKMNFNLSSGSLAGFSEEISIGVTISSLNSVISMARGEPNLEIQVTKSKHLMFNIGGVKILMGAIL